MKAVIMAGGKGTRLRPLTCYTPKPMVPLLNRPCMEYIIELLRKYGITEIAVTVQYLPDVIRSYFGDGSDFGVKLHYFEESSPLGTAGSVKNAENFLDETFLVISGDALTDFNLQNAIDYHIEKQAVSTLVLTRVETPLEFGVVMTDGDGRVTRFLEKPSWSEVFSDTVNTGIYILEPEIFKYYDKEVVFDFSSDLFPILMEDGKPLYGYVAQGYWSDIGNIHQYRRTQFDMLSRVVDVHIAAEEIKPGLWLEPGVTLSDTISYSGPVLIGRGSRLGENVDLGSYTVIGRNNQIEGFSVLQRSVLWDGNHLSERTELQGATLCGGVQLGTGVTLFDESVIGQNVVIGNQSVIKSRVKLWPGKLIGDNSTVHTSLIWGDQMSRVLFGSNGVVGIANVDITPDFVSKLASAYGAILPAGSKVSVSHCSHRFSKLIKNALSSGLHSAGIHTVDFGTTLTAVAKVGINRLDLNGGIHIRMLDSNRDNRCVIEFMDKTGLPIAKSVERKIENAFHQEDYVRSPIDLLGTEESHHRLDAWYIERLTQQVSMQALRGRKFKLVMQYHHRNFGDLILRFIDTFKCSVISYYSEERVPNQELNSLVKNNGADLGVFLDPNGQNMVLITSQGFVIQGDLLLALKALVTFQSEPEISLGIPVSAPHIVETIAASFGGQVIRTKENMRSILEAGGPRPFHPLFDELYSLAKVMEYMTTQETDLSELLGIIPQFHLVRDSVTCPWSEKGKVMRVMMQETQGNYVELLDGIKIHDEEGWVLILPDLDLPAFKIIAQAKSRRAAEEMVSTYSKRVKDSYQFEEHVS